MANFRHPFKRRLHIAGDGSYPSLKTDRLEHTHLRQLQICLQIVGLVLGGGEAKLGLKYPHLVQVDIYHRLFQLGKTELGGLYAVSIGYINKINLGHVVPPVEFNHSIYLPSLARNSAYVQPSLSYVTISL